MGHGLPIIISNLTPDLILWPVSRVNQHPPAHHEGWMDGWMVQETGFLLGFSSLANPGAYLSCYFTTYLLIT